MSPPPPLFLGNKPLLNWTELKCIIAEWRNIGNLVVVGISDEWYCKTNLFCSQGVLMKHKWENAMTIDKKSWGYRRTAALADYLDMDELIELLTRTVR